MKGKATDVHKAQLFLDDEIIELTVRLQRFVHQPLFRGIRSVMATSHIADCRIPGASAPCGPSMRTAAMIFSSVSTNTPRYDAGSNIFRSGVWAVG